MAACLGWCARAAEPAGGGDLAAAVEEHGVELAAGAFGRLPEPWIGADGGVDRAALEKLAGPAGWERFSEDAATAPVSVVIEPVAAGGTRVGHAVRTGFTLRVPLEKLETEDALKRSLGADEDARGASATTLSAGDLAAVGVMADEAAGERFVFVEIPLLNRVKVRGVVRAVKAECPAGVRVAWEFDPRFAAAPAWRATWTRIEENELGNRVEGEPHPYRGCGGVIVVRKLEPGAGAGDLLVVESRMVIAEPQEWFQGSNLLRSKIPLTTQEGVRSLRRKLAAVK